MDFESIKVDGHIVMVTGITIVMLRDPVRDLGKVEITVTPAIETDDEPSDDDLAKIKRVCERVVEVANKLGRTCADPAPTIVNGAVRLTTDVTRLELTKQRGYVNNYAAAVQRRLKDSLVETNDSRELVTTGPPKPKLKYVNTGRHRAARR